MTIRFPANIRVHPRPSVTLAGTSVSGGRTLSGVERIKQGDAGYWRMSLPIIILNHDNILALRAIDAILGGRAGAIIVPVYDGSRSPGALPNYLLPNSSVPHSDGFTFSDGSTYRGSIYSASVKSSAAARATTIVATIAQTPVVPPQPGMYFSIGDRLHRIKSVSMSGADATMTFAPPLRYAVSAGKHIEFDDPRGTWRLADDTGLVVPEGSFRPGQRMTIDLVEAL